MSKITVSASFTSFAGPLTLNKDGSFCSLHRVFPGFPVILPLTEPTDEL